MVLAPASFLPRYVVRPTRRKVLGAIVALGALPVAAREPLRLLAIGDSLTQGYGLPEAEGFVPTLERWLRGRGAEVDVVNMGVSGDTTAGGRARIGWALGDGADAAIVALGGNDLLRGIPPEQSRANLSAILAELTAAGVPTLLAGLRAPLNYGADFKAAFDGMYAEVADEHGALLYPFFLDGVRDDPAMIQPDGIHPSARGVERMVEGIGPSVERLLDLAAPGRRP